MSEVVRCEQIVVQKDICVTAFWRVRKHNARPHTKANVTANTNQGKNNHFVDGLKHRMHDNVFDPILRRSSAAALGPCVTSSIPKVRQGISFCFERNDQTHVREQPAADMDTRSCEQTVPALSLG